MLSMAEEHLSTYIWILSIRKPTAGSVMIEAQPINAGTTLQTNIADRSVEAGACTAIPHQSAPTKLRIIAPYMMSAMRARIGSTPVESSVESASPQKGSNPSSPGIRAAEGMRAEGVLCAVLRRSDIIAILPTEVKSVE
jgi:hypothetical protein